MENHPTKHESLVVERHHTVALPHRAKANHTPKKKESFIDFLLESNFAPLAFAGRCIRQFGASAVAGFLLGAISLYGYAVVWGVPYVKSSQQNPPGAVPQLQAKTVRLHGLVRDSEGKPVKEAFYVGVLAKQLGPIQNSDGSFDLEVPQSSSYDVALWNSDTVKVYTGFAAEQDGRGYRLEQALPFLHSITNVSALSSKPGALLPQLKPGEKRNASVNGNPTADARLNSSLKSTNLATADPERRTK